MLTWNDILSLRLQRQHLQSAVSREHYDQFYLDMSPVPTRYWTAPGDPPTLPAHVDFDDYDYNSCRRAKRDLLKGRFAGGSIAYVTKEDLELFACLYKKEMLEFTPIQAELLELLRQEGPMNIQLMKELTGLLVKEITPALHKLQEAFILYEDQLDNEGDRGWYLFESEFPEVDINRYTKLQALKQVLPRAARLLIFSNEELLKSYYRLPMKLIKEAIFELVEEKVLLPVTLEERSGYLLMEDKGLLQQELVIAVEEKVVLLQRNDFMVRAYAEHLKEAFPSEWDVLYYLLIGREIHGAVVGRFKFGPHIIEDIVLDLSTDEQVKWQEDILTAVYEVFDQEASPVKRFAGKNI